METQLIEALPRMGDAANHPELKQAIQKPSGGDALSSAPAGRDPAALGNRALEHVAQAMQSMLREATTARSRRKDTQTITSGCPLSTCHGSSSAGAPRPKLRVRTFWPKLQDREYAQVGGPGADCVPPAKTETPLKSLSGLLL